MASLIWDAKNPTPAQREWAFHYAVALLETKDAAPNYLDKVSATALVYVLKEKRAIPYLLPLLQHPDSKIRGRAQGVLASLGYQQTAEKS